MALPLYIVIFLFFTIIVQNSATTNIYDTDLKPCDNFYQYVCSKLLDSTVVSKSEPLVNWFVLNKKRIGIQLRSLMEEPIGTTDPYSFQIVKRFYKSCKKQEKSGFKLEEILENVLDRLNGWPVVKGDDWNENSYDWQLSYKTLKDIGYVGDYLFSLKINIDLTDEKEHAVELGPFGINFLLDISKGDNNGYLKSMVDTAVKFGANETTARKELELVLEFGKNLIQISSSHNYSSVTHDAMKLEDLDKRFRLKKFIRLIFPIDIRDEEIMIVRNIDMVESIVKLLNVTSDRTLANYVMWNVILESLVLFEPNDCVEQTLEHFPLNVDAMFMEKYVPPEVKINVGKIFDNIKEQYIKILEQINQYMSIPEIIETIANTTLYFADSDGLLDVEKLNNDFATLILNEDNYFHNILTINGFEIKRSYSTLRKPNIQSEWSNFKSRTQLPTCLIIEDKKIGISSGCVRGLFNSNQFEPINYAKIGSVIAFPLGVKLNTIHEIFHKNDSRVDHYNSKNFTKLREKVVQLEREYELFIFDHKMNRRYTPAPHGITIYDHTNTRMVYLAYQECVKRRQCIQLTNSNLKFWMSVANMFCTKYYSEHWKNIYEQLSEFRVNNILSNSNEFSRDFHCESDAKMNPTNKTVLW